MSCHVRSHHVPHEFLDYCKFLFEMYYTVEAQRRCTKCKESCESRKVILKSKNHKGSQKVTREVKDHPIGYIYTLIVQENEFSPWILPQGIKETS